MADVLDITKGDIAGLPNAVAKAHIKALLMIRQALFDILGSYPQDNVLPYFYSFMNTTATPSYPALTANGTGNNSIRISNDAAFIACSVRGSSNGDYTIFMRQDSSDRQLMNAGNPTHSSAFVGTAERPAPLHKPLLLEANTTVSFDLADLSGATNNIWFTLAGFKIYKPRAS